MTRASSLRGLRPAAARRAARARRTPMARGRAYRIRRSVTACAGASSRLADQPHLALRRWYDDAMRPQRGKHRGVNLAGGLHLVLHRHPGFDRNADGGIAELHRLHDRRRVLQHAWVGPQHAADQLDDTAEIAFVGHSDADLHLTDPAVIVQNLADHLAVGYDNHRAIDVAELRVEERDRLDHALDAGDGDVLADAERLGEDNRQSRNHVAQHALSG